MIDITTKFLLIAIPYLVLTFVWTALYVRWGRNENLIVCFRKRFYLFPVIPVGMIVIFAVLVLRMTGANARRLFEILAGKRTYHRRRLSYYRLGNVKFFPRSSARAKKVPEAVRPRAVVNDNQAVRSAFSFVRFRS